MKKLYKIVSAALTGVMLISASVPATAAENDIAVIDLASAPMVISEGTPENYPTPTGTDISINIVGAGETESVDTSSLEAGKFAKIKAEETHNGYNFSHYEYVTTARNYVASYDKEFTFYVDPPMTINVVYATDPITSANGIVAGMYKNPEVKEDGNTYFYCSVAGAKGNNTTAEITFGRSQKDERDTDNNSETITTATEQNIYDEEDTDEHNTFQYIVSSGIQTGGPIDFKADISDTTTNALIKTWDFSSGAFYNAKANDTINGLTVTKDTYLFNVNAGDKIRVYTSSLEPAVYDATEIARDENKHIYEYKADGMSITVNKGNVTKIMVNPMDVVIAKDGQAIPEQPASTTGTIEVKVISNSTVNKGKLLSGATVEATKSENNVTIPETDEGVYSLSVPDGSYNVKVTLNGIEAIGNTTVNKGETVTVEIPIKDIEAEREEKINTYINEILLKETDPSGNKNSTDPWAGSVWNSESREFKWSYINGCMITAFMDMYEITKKDIYKTNSDTYSVKFLDGNNKVNSNAGDINSRTDLDDINPGKSLLDLIDNNSANANKFETTVEQLHDIVERADRVLDNNGKRVNFVHKESYPKQVWLDGTYMALPFMIQYDYVMNKGNDQLLKDAADVTAQFENIYNKMKDEGTGLYYHGYDAQADNESKSYSIRTAMSWARRSDDPTDNAYNVNSVRSTASKDGCSSSFWGRAMGWYAMALIDTYEQMEIAENRTGADLTENKNSIKKIFTELMDSVLKYQYELDSEGQPTGEKGKGTGLWYQVIDNPQVNNSKYNYIETSGSAAFAVSLMKGYNLRVLIDEKYYNAGLNAFNAITDHKLTIKKSNGEYSPKENGISDICGQAGLAGYENSELKNNTSKSAGYETGKGRGPKHYYRDGSFDYYVSEDIGQNDAKGAAPYLMAYAQKLKHDKDLQSANS